MNKYIIYTSFSILSVYNHSFNLIRPTEILLPFVVILFFIYYKKISKLFIYGLVFMVYIVINMLINTENHKILFGLHNALYWTYCIIFIMLSKLFSDINILQYKKTILTSIWISLAFILLIYFFNSIGLQLTEQYFSNFNEDDFFEREINQRTPGVSYAIIFMVAIIFYLLKVKKTHYLWLFVFVAVLFWFNSSRQTLILFILLLMFLHLSKKVILTAVLALLFFYSSLFPIASYLANSENAIARRIAETIYFYDSPSMFVRISNTQQALMSVYEKNILMGLGSGAELNLIQYAVKLDYSKGIKEVDETSYGYLDLHCPDNSFLLMLIDGGIFLLLIMILLAYRCFYTINRYDKNLAWCFILIIIITGLLSKHLITNYIISFILGFIYFYSAKQLRQRHWPGQINNFSSLIREKL